MEALSWMPGAVCLPTPTRAELADLPESTAPKSGQRVFNVITPCIETDDDLAAALLPTPILAAFFDTLGIDADAESFYLSRCVATVLLIPHCVANVLLMCC